MAKVKEYSVTPAIVAHYAPKDKWGPWREHKVPEHTSAPIRTGKTLAERLRNYTDLCRKAGKELTTEKNDKEIVLRNCTSWARFIQSDELVPDKEQHEKEMEYWAMVSAEMRAGKFYKVVYA